MVSATFNFLCAKKFTTAGHSHGNNQQREQDDGQQYRDQSHMRLFTFPLCKFFQNEVQIPMRFLARPVTGYETHHDSGYDKYADDYDSSLYHMSVPLILPSMIDTAIAEMNMPAMMYTKSM